MSWIDEKKFCLLIFFAAICCLPGEGEKALGMIRGKVFDKVILQRRMI